MSSAEECACGEVGAVVVDVESALPFGWVRVADRHARLEVTRVVDEDCRVWRVSAFSARAPSVAVAAFSGSV
jgi:hypothetical protein